MAQRKAGRDEFNPTSYLLNKGLQPSTRQRDKEQTTSRLGSDFTAKKCHNSPTAVPEQQQAQKYGKFMSSLLVDSQQPHQSKEPQPQQQKVNENNERVKRQSQQRGERKQVSNVQKEKSFRPNCSRYKCGNRCSADNSSSSSSSSSDTERESEVESFFDNGAFIGDQSESVVEADDDIDESILDLQKGLNKITNKYVRNVKSQVEGAMSKLKFNETRKNNLLPKQEAKQLGAGDIRSPQTDELYKKMELMKKECYKKIEANLNMLKNIDNLTDEIHKNHFMHRKTFK